MITVTDDRSFGSYRVLIEGHAGYADEGKDIVCSAVSILSYGLASIATRMYSEGKFSSPPNIVMDVGHASITCFPDNRYTDEMDHAFQFFWTGIDLLVARYPEYVQIGKA